jgi:predicted DNA-binding protein
MGRPPLNVKDIKIRLSPETRARIEALVGNYQIAGFIREAIERELTRQETERGVEMPTKKNPSTD